VLDLPVEKQPHERSAVTSLQPNNRPPLATLRKTDAHTSALPVSHTTRGPSEMREILAHCLLLSEKTRMLPHGFQGAPSSPRRDVCDPDTPPGHVPLRVGLVH